MGCSTRLAGSGTKEQVSRYRFFVILASNMQDGPMSKPSENDTLQALLTEIWDRFHPGILWWANKKAATDPDNARMVYRQLLSGPRGAMDYAVRLKPLLPPLSE